MKRFWHILRKVLTITAVILCAALFLVTLTSAIQKKAQLKCNQLFVHIDYDSGISFLKEQEVTERLNYLSGNDLPGRILSSIDFKTLERELEENPFVEHAVIFVDGNRNIIANITQKRPILRILNSDGVSYYMGEKGEHIPLSDNFTPHVTIATGMVENHESPMRDSIVLVNLYQLVLALRGDDFLNALVDQIVVKEDGTLDFIPKISGHVIHFGQVDENMNEKFSRLKTFYNEGMRKVGWNKYKAIDLRFNNQVVCEKRDTTNTL